MRRRTLTNVAVACAVALTPVLGVGTAARAATPVADPASLVDPFIGTDGTGNTFPGADMPYGMLQWGPDTTSRPHGGGYQYTDSSISGFSLTHVDGPGCDAAGDIPFLPEVGAVDATPNSDTQSFSHGAETASPGYYSVGLGNGVTTQLTTTVRAGIARFTYPATTSADMLVKLGDSQTPATATTVNVVGGDELTGSVTTTGFCEATNPFTLYFAVTFDHPFTATGGYGTAGTSSAGEYVTFDTTANQTVEARVGISYTSVAEAAANRDAEVAGQSFDAVRTAAHAAWETQLGRVAIAGGTAAQQTEFYTALYHASLFPSVFSDADGAYLGEDGARHTVGAGHAAQYADFSGWDIYRTQAQLTALLDPARASDMAQSMVEDYQQGGVLPKWQMDNGETYIMVGDSAAPILADYYAFGARNFDTAGALHAMIAQATAASDDRPGNAYLDSFGYLPTDSIYGCCHEYATTSTQLEYDTDDFAVSALAGDLGDTADQARFQNRAQDWRNILDSSTGWIEPRHSNGQWLSSFVPAPITGGTSSNDFAEDDSLVYTGMVPFNLAGLTAAKGGDAAMTDYLNTVLAGYSGLLSLAGFQANLGNEPSFELPWEYDYVGAASATQRDVRQIDDQLYTTSYSGLPGNDDLGAMSAWFVWSALGLYPETPGTADLALAGPMFTQTVITPAGGDAITINAPAAADSAPYIQGLTIDGAASSLAYLPAADVRAGATLNVTLGTSADTGWAAAPSDAPPSYDGTATPLPTEPNGPITSSVAGRCADDAGGITLDGTPIQLYACNGTAAQHWTVVPDGTLQVFGKCMGVANGATTAGSGIQLQTCAGTPAQQWSATSAGQLVNPGSGLCLSGTAQLQLTACPATETWTLPN